MSSIIIPISICVILPIAVVLIISLTRINSDNKRTEVIVKAIEANNNIDADKLAESLRRPWKSEREILNTRLLRGCIFSFLGILFLAIGVASLLNGSEFSSDPVTVPMLLGGASLAVGLGYVVVYFVTRKQVIDDHKD